jgi:hypothetical protein
LAIRGRLTVLAFCIHSRIPISNFEFIFTIHHSSIFHLSTYFRSLCSQADGRNSLKSRAKKKLWLEFIDKKAWIKTRDNFREPTSYLFENYLELIVYPSPDLSNNGNPGPSFLFFPSLFLSKGSPLLKCSKGILGWWRSQVVVLLLSLPPVLKMRGRTMDGVPTYILHSYRLMHTIPSALILICALSSLLILILRDRLQPTKLQSSIPWSQKPRWWWWWWCGDERVLGSLMEG